MARQIINQRPAADNPGHYLWDRPQFHAHFFRSLSVWPATFLPESQLDNIPFWQVQQFPDNSKNLASQDVQTKCHKQNMLSRFYFISETFVQKISLLQKKPYCITSVLILASEEIFCS